MRVALITCHKRPSISNPMLNTVLFFVKNNIKVDLFIGKYENNYYPEFINTDIKIILCYNKYFDYKVIRQFYFILRILFQFKKYKIIIGYDPEGFIIARIIRLFIKAKLIYHSLELQINNKKNIINHKCFIKRKLEIIFSKKADIVITQDRNRSRILSVQCMLPFNKVTYIYNTSIGVKILNKNNYFRNKFNIPECKDIVLAIGTISVEHGIDKIIDSVMLWPDNFVLVIHGWITRKKYEDMVKEKLKNNNRVFLSLENLKWEEKYKIYSSVDFGLVFFEPININLKYTGGSAGKIFDFIKAGIPIIANNIPGFRTIIEENKFGILVNNYDEIGYALETIKQNYINYRQNAYGACDIFSFENQFKKILELIDIKTDKMQ